jgi:hypothetical protein
MAFASSGTIWTRLAHQSLHNAYHLSLRQLEKLRYVESFLLAHEKVEEPLVPRSEIASAVHDEVGHWISFAIDSTE